MKSKYLRESLNYSVSTNFCLEVIEPSAEEMFIFFLLLGIFLVKVLMTPPLGVKNIKIQETSDKMRGPLGVPTSPSTTINRSLKKFSEPYCPLKGSKLCNFLLSHSARLPSLP